MSGQGGSSRPALLASAIPSPGVPAGRPFAPASAPDPGSASAGSRSVGSRSACPWPNKMTVHGSGFRLRASSTHLDGGVHLVRSPGGTVGPVGSRGPCPRTNAATGGRSGGKRRTGGPPERSEHHCGSPRALPTEPPGSASGLAWVEESASLHDSSPISPRAPGANRTKGTKAVQRLCAGRGDVYAQARTLRTPRSAHPCVNRSCNPHLVIRTRGAIQGAGRRAPRAR
jgi:hypothetical protein